MKYLIVIRHAKSNQQFLGNDFERPLNSRGIKDAPQMAERLLIKNLSIDGFVSSPAIRAKSTAGYFAKAYKTPLSEIQFISALYHASSETLFDVVSLLPDSLDTVALFSHNPGITYFVNDLNAGIQIDNMPTCGMVGVQINSSNWSDFKKAKKTFGFFDYPKKV